MSRFFVRTEAVDLQNGRITITGEDVKHIGNVLRASAGDTLELSDGSGTDFDVVVEHISKEYITTRITASKPNETEPPVDITLFQGIPKSDKMDFIIQKCVELGVRTIIPVMTARSVVRFRNARDAAAKTARWRRIALEAAKQCDRGMIPSVEEPVRFKQALQMVDDCGLRILPYEEEKDMTLRGVLFEHKSAMQCDDGAVQSDAGMKRIAVFIGPEGGFDPGEKEKALESGFRSVTLGPRILRTETAGIAITAVVMYELGDMGGS